jgi:hypothetical protein
MLTVWKMAAFGGFAAATGLALVGCGTTRAGYESAGYSVSSTDGVIEVRQYSDMTLVGTSTGQPRDESEDSAFMRLFRYISGGNEDDRKIAMTTPVFSTKDKSDADNMEMFFVVPNAEKDDAPEPNADSVRLVKQSAMTVAAVRFNGRMSTSVFEQRKKQIDAWLEETGATAEGEYWMAQYDPPWTPGVLRRNEVLVRISESNEEQ